MLKKQVSKLISGVLKKHSIARIAYRRKELNHDGFMKELNVCLDGLSKITDIHGDSVEIDSAKEVVWYSIELYKKW